MVKSAVRLIPAGGDIESHVRVNSLGIGHDFIDPSLELRLFLPWCTIPVFELREVTVKVQ